MIDFLKDVCQPIGFLVIAAIVLIVLWSVATAIYKSIRTHWHEHKMSQRPRFKIKEWEDDMSACTDYEIWCKWKNHDWQKLRDENGTRIAFGDYLIAKHLVWILNSLPCCTSGFRAMFNPQTQKNYDPKAE